MSFKYSVIGDNTIENIEHLEKIGFEFVNESNNRTYILTSKDGVAWFSNSIGWDHINCIGNPQLFKAVSAMRDDSDSVIENGELWASVKEYPNYQVSHKGNIRSLNYNRTGDVS